MTDTDALVIAKRIHDLRRALDQLAVDALAGRRLDFARMTLLQGLLEDKREQLLEEQQARHEAGTDAAHARAWAEAAMRLVEELTAEPFHDGAALGTGRSR